MVLYTMWKKAHESPAYFMEIFNTQADKINSHRGRSGYHPNIYKKKMAVKCKEANTAYEGATTEIRQTALDESCMEYMAYLIVKTYDNGWYRGLNNVIDNGHLMGKYDYPNKMKELLTLLDKYKVLSGITCQTTTRESAGVASPQKGKVEKHKTDTEKDPKVNKSGK